MSENEKQGSITRRGFLKGAGVTAAGSLILEQAQVLNREAHAAIRENQTLGPHAIPITLLINGQSHKVTVEPRATLAETLRDHLDLTGTKVVCDRGSCSACTVWLDKVPALACMTLAVDVGKREVTTIEGLADGEHLHPLQAAFVKHDALQCGFCTSGMIMSCAALLERNPNPTLGDVKHAVSGNLCRCASYPKVFSATLDAAANSRNLAQISGTRAEREA
ncbi:MAG TPA: (2Fe-2S)-binding protein [Acidobacteriaceae bacterium]